MAEVVEVSVSNLGGTVVYGPEKLAASLTVGELKMLFDAGRQKTLINAETTDPVSDEEPLSQLAEKDEEGTLCVEFMVSVAAPLLRQTSSSSDLPPKPRLQRLFTWEKKLKEYLQEGDVFGDQDEYVIETALGKGAQAQVFKCRSEVDGQHYAVKCFRRTEVEKSDSGTMFLKRELSALKHLQHSGIVRVEKVISAPTHEFVVMELAREDLFTTMRGRVTEALRENEARHIFVQMLGAMHYMHLQSILHRDLKLANVLVFDSVQVGEDLLYTIKIGDLGLSKKVNRASALAAESPKAAKVALTVPGKSQPKLEPGPPELERVLSAPQPGALDRATTDVGTKNYSAPEVISEGRRQSGGCYDAKADYFSLGVCLYAMLFAYEPQTEDSLAECFEDKEELADAADFFEGGEGLSEDVKKLIGGLLKMYPQERFGFEECSQHPWVGDAAQNLDTEVTLRLPSTERTERLLSVEEDDEESEGEGLSGKRLPPPAKKW